MRLAHEARPAFLNSVLFAGQLLSARDPGVSRALPNSTAFTRPRRFFPANLPFVLLPIRVGEPLPAAM